MDWLSTNTHNKATCTHGKHEINKHEPGIWQKSKSGALTHQLVFKPFISYFPLFEFCASSTQLFYLRKS